MGILTAFLSHSHDDRETVLSVRRELGKLGIIGWIDRNELAPGISLDEALRDEISHQSVFVPFLSKASVESEWLKYELSVALGFFSKSDERRIIPVWLGNSLELTNRVDALKSRWVFENRVKKLGIQVEENSGIQDANRIAEGIATRILKDQIGTPPSAVFFVDQRGEGGSRVGKPPSLAPVYLDSKEVPVFVFRHDDGERTKGHMLEPEREGSFDRLVRGIRWTLGKLTLNRGEIPWKLHLRAQAQLAIAAQLGRMIDRSHDLELWATVPSDRHGEFNVNLGVFSGPPTGGNPDALRIDSDLGEFDGPREREVSLFLMPDQKGRLLDARDHVVGIQGPPILWIPVPERVQSNDEVLRIACDVAAVCERYRIEQVDLYTALPGHVLPFVISLLSPHPLLRIDILEFDREVARSSYRRYRLVS